MVSAQYLKKYFTPPRQILYTGAPGQYEDQFELGDLDLIFKVTEVIEVDNIWRMVSAQYLKKYFMFPHQYWDKEAPMHDKE